MRDSSLERRLSPNAKGIEIGAGHTPMRMPAGCAATYVDHVPMAELRRRYPDARDLGHVVDEADTLATFIDSTQDFVVTSHVLEHCEDPIGAMRNWVRVLKPGGIIWCAIPEKTQTFDRDRPVTTMGHLWADAYFGSARTRREHYAEWFAIVDKLTDDVLLNRIELAMHRLDNIHFHVFDKALMYCFFQIPFGLETLEVLDNGAEMIWILRKKCAGT